MKVKTIPNSWMRRDGRRLDCRPYMSGALEAKIRLEEMSCRKDRLSELTDGHDGGIYNGPHFSRTFVDGPEYGVPFLGTSSMLRADLSDLPLLRKRDALSAKLAYLRVEPGMTLISCSGTIGRMVYVRADMAGMWTSQHIMKVVPNSLKVPSGYLYAFLSSKYGVPLVTSGTYGSIIQSIEPQHIADLPVPRLGDELEARVADFVDRAAQAAVDGAVKYREATARAFHACGLEPHSPQSWHAARKLSFLARFTELQSLRALNNDPRMAAFFRKVRNSSSYALIAELLERAPFRPNRFKRIDANEQFGVPLIGQREMFRLHWEGRMIAWSGIPDRDEVCAPAGTIAAACIGTLGENEVYGRVLRIRPKQSQFALSDNVLQLRANAAAVPTGFLFALLRSETYFRIFRCLSVGGKQQVLHQDLVSRVPIPLAERGEMDAIDELVRHGDLLLDQAVALENEARAHVEHAIEQAT